MKTRSHFFRTRLLISFLLCSLIPLLLCSVFQVQIIRSRLNTLAEQDLQQNLSHVTQSVDLLSQGLTQAAQELSQNPWILNAMKGGAAEETKINSILFKATENFRGYASISLYSLDGKMLFSTESGDLPPDLPLKWGILYAVQNASRTPVFRHTNQNGVLLRGAVPLKDDSGFPMGYLVLQMDHKDFLSLFEGKYNAQDDLLIVNSFWRPVYSSNSSLLNDAAPEFRHRLLEGEPLKKEGYSYAMAKHEPTGLYLILQKPQAFNQNTTHMMYAICLSCALLCVVFSVIIYLPMSNQISAPVRQLQKAFGKLETDDLEVQVPSQRKDELGQLAQSFNRMVKALKQNRKDLIQNQKELNEAQIRLLQTQLNPHFLCNTLDTMKWISKINNVPEVAEMSANLADILRYCITPEEFVPLYREIDFLDRYVDIQKIRMKDRFSFRVDLPEELGTCIVPKMILQPLVENAIIHGLSDTDDSAITVTIRTVGEMLKITVTDNGCGLPEELAGKPYTRPPASEGKHLGLYNVNTILSKHYGAGCGLYLDHGPNGVGTTVTATLPRSIEEVHHDKSFGC